MADNLLIFEINGSRFGIESARITTLSALNELTGVPGMPKHIAGVCNLHGDVIPVVDLCSLWDISHEDEYKCIILIRHQGADIAVMADSVIETQSLPDETNVLDVDVLIDSIEEGTI